MQRLRYIIIGLLLVLSSLYIIWPPNIGSANYTALDNHVLIGHAGSGINAGTYSNSKEAIDKAVDHGFTYIEVDFLQVKNGDWVLMHDWNRTHLRYFSRFPRLPQTFLKSNHIIPDSAEHFKRRKMRFGLTQMSLQDLALWLQENPKLKVVTDIKGSNLVGLTAIKTAMKGKTDQIIPQIYTVDEYKNVHLMGYEHIIFTAYKSSMSAQAIADFCKNNELFALTVPKRWITKDVMSILSKSSVPVFTHTVNNPDEAGKYSQLGVKGFYTDYLIPKQGAK